MEYSLLNCSFFNDAYDFQIKKKLRPAESVIVEDVVTAEKKIGNFLMKMAHKETVLLFLFVFLFVIALFYCLIPAKSKSRSNSQIFLI